jgi:hypothetical protein
METVALDKNEAHFTVEEEAALVQAARSDAAAFAALYRRYVTPVFATCINGLATRARRRI